MSVELIDLIWSAGFIDGEGCFTCSNTGVFVRVAHSHKPSLEFLQSIFGGTLHQHNHGRPAHYKDIWRWVVCGEEAKKTCIQLLPYLKEKRPQAQLILAILETRTGRGIKPSLELKRNRDTLKQMLSNLKKKQNENI
jgi:hypothetical protein